MRSTDSYENSLAKINFGGQRRYGQPPRIFQRHNNSVGQHHRRRFDRYSGYKQDNEQKAFKQRCFNCSSPAYRISTCPKPKNQDRIEANLLSWRKSKQIKKPLRELNLASISSSSYVISEVITAEIFLGHCKANAQPTNFFESVNTHASIQFPLNMKENNNDPSILFTSLHMVNFNDCTIPHDPNILNELPVIDLATGIKKQNMWTGH